MSMIIEQAKAYYPSRSVVGKIFPHRLKYLIMAPPKWGKTTFFSGVPNCLMLCFEEGHGFVTTHKVVINAWDLPMHDRGPSEDEETGVIYCSAMEILEALETHNPYQFIIIDTADQAVKLCTDYECKRAKLQHPSDGGDYGKGFDLYQTGPFRRFYNRVVKLGAGIAVTTHVKEEWKKDRYGIETFRRETSLPGGIQRFVHGQSDVIINGLLEDDKSYERRLTRKQGSRDRYRVISFDGSNEIMAGTRIRGVHIPNRYVVTPPSTKQPNAPWKQWKGFFDDSPKAGEAAEKEFEDLIRVKSDVETGKTETVAVENKTATNKVNSSSNKPIKVER